MVTTFTIIKTLRITQERKVAKIDLVITILITLITKIMTSRIIVTAEIVNMAMTAECFDDYDFISQNLVLIILGYNIFYFFDIFKEQN